MYIVVVIITCIVKTDSFKTEGGLVQMSINCPISGGQMHNQEADVQ